ncbi:uncharacterized protein TNCV_150431 [Trichonephila clavipes]|nr:uncharacterized protein TNCV_150431 [Trichonephila clavipes]
MPQILIHLYQPSDVRPTREFPHDHSQTSDRAKFTLVPASMPPATAKSYYGGAWLYQTCLDVRRPILLSLLHATQALNQKLWSGVTLLLTAGPLSSSLEAHLQHNGTSTIFFFAAVSFAVQWTYFSADKTRPHAARVVMNCLTACQTLPWPARSPDLSSMEHVWNMMGKRLHLPGNVDNLAQ